ncbi:GNAT family N-acetyltransferase [Nocardia sp. NBC_00565]|uniref:GNAT family N-acetyltransferase n=1 Tax=Nocardia sp. NBC_00565 TaxID=2975993 RepID=UPI002E80B33D|nr:GNAT family N-acetyltransferase [Nocardia sp. NBC_00565]WUC03783.1 GNAT family N-acetyltransferase [Nocardia sp. NBC_00565]
MVEDIARTVVGLAKRSVDAAMAAGVSVDRYYTKAGGDLREIARRTAVLDHDSAGVINTAGGREARLHTRGESAGTTMGAEQLLAASSRADTAAVRRTFEIVPATTADVSGIVRTLFAAIRKGYANLPGAENGGVDRLIADMETRLPGTFTHSLSDGNSTIFVHRTPEGEVTGFLGMSMRSDGAGQIDSWYVQPEWQKTGVARALMHKALDTMGDVDVYSGTTQRTEAYQKYLQLGFEPEGALTATPPPMQAAGLVGEQQAIRMDRNARAALLRLWNR